MQHNQQIPGLAILYITSNIAVPSRVMLGSLYGGMFYRQWNETTSVIPQGDYWYKPADKWLEILHPDSVVRDKV